MHPHRRFKVLSVVTGVLIAIALAAVSLCIYWLVYPYDDFYMDPGPYRLTDVTRDADGVPLVVEGESLAFTLTGLCNQGVDTVSNQRIDIYDKYLFFSPTDAVPAASISVPPWQFYKASTGKLSPCPTDVPVSVKVPDYIEHHLIYRFRFEITYKPNPIRTIVTTGTTERFRLVGEQTDAG